MSTMKYEKSEIIEELKMLGSDITNIRKDIDKK